MQNLIKMERLTPENACEELHSTKEVDLTYNTKTCRVSGYYPINRLFQEPVPVVCLSVKGN